MAVNGFNLCTNQNTNLVNFIKRKMVEDNAQEVDAAKPTENASKTLFSVDILRLIRNAQKQHGLRHGDYQRYRGLYIFFNLFFCIHDIRHNNLRKSLQCK